VVEVATQARRFRSLEPIDVRAHPIAINVHRSSFIIASDPGILFQLYYPVPTSYTIPGPVSSPPALKFEAVLIVECLGCLARLICRRLVFFCSMYLHINLSRLSEQTYRC